jgi:hypothetical protein
LNGIIVTTDVNSDEPVVKYAVDWLFHNNSLKKHRSIVIISGINNIIHFSKDMYLK